MQNSNFTLYLLGAFLVLNLLIGLWFGRKSKTMRDYALANKSYGTGPLVMTYLATNIGGSWLFVRPQELIDFGIGSFLYTVAGGLAMIIRGKFIAHRMLPFKNCLSLGDFIGAMYGVKSKILAGVLSILMSTVIAGLQIACLGKVFEQFLGLEKVWGILLSGFTIGIYSSIGGIRAVTSTDIFQFILLIITLFSLAGLAIKASGSAEIVLSKLPKGKLNFLSNLDYFYYCISIIILRMLFSSEMVDPAMLDRMLMAKSPFHLRKMQYISGIITVVIITLIVLMSFAALNLYPDIDSSSVVLHLINNLLPIELKGIAVIGILAVLFSTCDSYMHSAGVGIAHDVLKPVFNNIGKKINELTVAKYSTFIVATLSIVFALWGKNAFMIDYIFNIIAPILISPMLLGILGIKPEKKAFWTAGAFAVVSFILCKIFLIPPYESLSLLIPCFVSAIVFMVVHIIINKSIVLVNNEGYNNPQPYHWKPTIEKFFGSITYLLTYPFFFAQRCRERVIKHKAPFELFGVFYCVVLVAPYFLWDQLPAQYEYIVFYLRLVGVVLCSLLMTISIWPQVAVPYLPAFWYIAVMYCIPFLSTLFLLITNGSTDYIVNIAVTIMLLIMLVDWASAVVMSGIGIVAAYLFYKYFVVASDTMGLEELHFTFNSKYVLAYQIVLGSAIGLLFASKKQYLFNKQRLNIDNLRVVLDIERGQFEELQSAGGRIAAGLAKREIDIMPSIEEMKLLFNKIKDVYQADKKMLEYINNSINTVSYLQELVKNAKNYLKLNVKNVNINNVLNPVSQLAEYYMNDNYSVVLRSDSHSIECDDKKLSYILTQAIYEVCRLNINDDHLTIDVSDTKIGYKLSSLKNYEKVVDAYIFTISTAPYIPNYLFKDKYEKSYKDPKQILSIPEVMYQDKSDIPMIAERLLDAHFGITEILEKAEGYTRIYIVPKKLRQVRPLPLDLAEPREGIITWKGAINLENQLKDSITRKAPKVDLAKIDKALNIIKKYHSHQARKSGEPYYLHSINVALIELEWSQEEETILAALMHDVLEDTAFTIFDIKAAFGDRVAEIVLGVSKLDSSFPIYHSNNEHLMILSKITDFAVLSIKISDRIHNMRTIGGHTSGKKRQKIAEETIKFFVPLAKRLDLQKAYTELQDLANKELSNTKP